MTGQDEAQRWGKNSKGQQPWVMYKDLEHLRGGYMSLQLQEGNDGYTPAVQ